MVKILFYKKLKPLIISKNKTFASNFDLFVSIKNENF